MPVLGANQESIQGPGTITHDGGDPILIADVEGGLPGTERTLIFDGADVRENFDDQVFTPVDAKDRSVEIKDVALIRAQGQANYSFSKPVEEKPAKKTPAKKEAKKEEAEVAA